MKPRTEIKVRREPWFQDTLAINLAQITTNDEGHRVIALAQPLTMKVVDDFCRETEPLLRITPEEGQGFMDELWRAGIRPTEGAGSVGQLAAVERHLQDMRKLVFEK